MSAGRRTRAARAARRRKPFVPKDVELPVILRDGTVTQRAEPQQRNRFSESREDC